MGGQWVPHAGPVTDGKAQGGLFYEDRERAKVRRRKRAITVRRDELGLDYVRLISLDTSC